MAFKCTDKSGFNVTLQQDVDDVDIVINGVNVARFTGEDSTFMLLEIFEDEMENLVGLQVEDYNEGDGIKRLKVVGPCDETFVLED